MIPVLHIIHHSIEVDSGGVGSLYIIMTKVDGVALSSILDDMEDSNWEIVLQQVVDILLDLASQPSTIHGLAMPARYTLKITSLQKKKKTSKNSKIKSLIKT